MSSNSKINPQTPSRTEIENLFNCLQVCLKRSWTDGERTKIVVASKDQPRANQTINLNDVHPPLEQLYDQVSLKFSLTTHITCEAASRPTHSHVIAVT
jgi:hypothetical protein